MKPHVRKVWTSYAGWLWGVFLPAHARRPVGLTHRFTNLAKMRVFSRRGVTK